MGRTTVVFTDIERSTVLNERLGDERFFEVLTRHNVIVRGCLDACGGREVKFRGDGFMAAFGEAAGAVSCSIDVQRELLRCGITAPDTRVRIRIGIHTGSVLEDGEDLVGRNVTIAARVMGRAKGGQILITDAARRAAGEDFAYGPRRTVALEGLRGQHVVATVTWQPDAPWRRPAPVPRARGVPRSRVYREIEKLLREPEDDDC